MDLEAERPTRANPVMKETEKAYLAGIIDGEGTVSIVRLFNHGDKVYYVASVEVSNTNLKLLNWISERVGGSKVPDRRKLVNGQKIVYRLGLRDRLAENVLREVSSYLVLKDRQAELVMELRSRIRKNGDRSRLTDSERAYRAHLYEECAKLNVRGTGNAERLSERSPETGVRQSELTGTRTVREGSEAVPPPIER